MLHISVQCVEDIELNTLDNKHFAVNPFSPSSDQHQMSPCNINPYSTTEAMRIEDMIIQSEFFIYILTSPHFFYKKSMGTR